MPTTTSPSLSSLIPGELTIGEPDVAGALAVFPLFGPTPTAEYISYAEGAARGVSVTELPGDASVNDLLVHNPLDVAVLLYEGEELIGAQQNRTLDVAVLVAANSKLQVPVSCVEHGRWDGSRHSEPFTPSQQSAYPSLRAAKSRQKRAAMLAGRQARADQGAVWNHVASKASELRASAPTEAMSDIYKHRRHDLDELEGAITRRDGQLGSLAAIGGRFVVLDQVSRPDAFAALHGPLVSGYALDSLGRESALRAAPPTMPAPSLRGSWARPCRLTEPPRAASVAGSVSTATASAAPDCSSTAS